MGQKRGAGRTSCLFGFFPRQTFNGDLGVGSINIKQQILGCELGLNKLLGFHKSIVREICDAFSSHSFLLSLSHVQIASLLLLTTSFFPTGLREASGIAKGERERKQEKEKLLSAPDPYHH